MMWVRKSGRAVAASSAGPENMAARSGYMFGQVGGLGPPGVCLLEVHILSHDVGILGMN